MKTAKGRATKIDAWPWQLGMDVHINLPALVPKAGHGTLMALPFCNFHGQAGSAWACRHWMKFLYALGLLWKLNFHMIVLTHAGIDLRTYDCVWIAFFYLFHWECSLGVGWCWATVLHCPYVSRPSCNLPPPSSSPPPPIPIPLPSQEYCWIERECGA